MLMKVRHQPMLLLILGGMLVVTGTFESKMVLGPTQRQWWFKNWLLVLSCVEPFLISLIIAVQVRFENQRTSMNPVLSLPSRSGWLENFIASTYLILASFVLCLLLILSPLIGIDDFGLALLCLLILGVVWLPLLEYFALLYHYLLAIFLGVVSLPFIIYYGTQLMGSGVWQFLPWVYSARIYALTVTKVLNCTIITVLVTVAEYLVLEWRFNRKEG